MTPTGPKSHQCWVRTVISITKCLYKSSRRMAIMTHWYMIYGLQGLCRGRWSFHRLASIPKSQQVLQYDAHQAPTSMVSMYFCPGTDTAGNRNVRSHQHDFLYLTSRTRSVNKHKMGLSKQSECCSSGSCHNVRCISHSEWPSLSADLILWPSRFIPPTEMVRDQWKKI